VTAGRFARFLGQATANPWVMPWTTASAPGAGTTVAGHVPRRDPP
jgi:hypothetical protein